MGCDGIRIWALIEMGFFFLMFALGLDYEGFGLGFELGAQAQAYAEDGAFDLSPFLLLP